MSYGRRSRGVAIALLSIGLIFSTSSCAVQSRSKQKYAGALSSPVSTCPSGKATLLVQDDVVVFSPLEGTWLLSGKITDNGIEASRIRPSFEGKTYSTVFKAVLTGSHIEGTYTTPSCTYKVDLEQF